jgi:hypothetical protein
MDEPIERRKLITAGAAFAMVAASANQAVAADTAAYPTATGAWGPKVSTDDYVEIQQLYAHYCHALDTGNPEAVANCWTQDGEFTHGFPPGQANADRKPASGYKMGGAGGSRHMNTNLVITKTPEGAKGSVYLLMYTATTTPDSFTELAIYDDTLVKTPQGWKFKKRVVWRDDDDISPFRAKQAPKRAAAAETPATPETR